MLDVHNKMNLTLSVILLFSDKDLYCNFTGINCLIAYEGNVNNKDYNT